MLTTNYVPGVPNWIDLGTPDIDKAAAFYGELFGWTHFSLGPEAGNYGFLQQDGKTVAALGPLGDSAKSAWGVYFLSNDADATTKAVEQAGGTVRFEPFDVFTSGRMAGFTDPGGAEFYTWQPGDITGLDLVTESGSLTWTELHTADPAAAQAFYGSVFGWEADVMPNSDGQYTLFRPPGSGEEASLGGVAQLQEGHSPHWLPYFEVPDCDATAAKASELGGSVVLAGMEAEGVGRMAWLADPYGARFAVVTSVSQ